MSIVSEEREQTCRTALTGILSVQLGDQRPIKATNGQIDTPPGQTTFELVFNNGYRANYGEPH